MPEAFVEGGYGMEVRDPSLRPVPLLGALIAIAVLASIWWQKELKELQQRGTQVSDTVTMEL